jgi:hypothetical protein
MHLCPQRSSREQQQCTFFALPSANDFRISRCRGVKCGSRLVRLQWDPLQIADQDHFRYRGSESHYRVRREKALASHGYRVYRTLTNRDVLRLLTYEHEREITTRHDHS